MWVWTKLTEQLHPDRKAGTEVPKGYLREGWDDQNYPDPKWVKNGWVEKKEASECQTQQISLALNVTEQDTTTDSENTDTTPIGVRDVAV